MICMRKVVSSLLWFTVLCSSNVSATAGIDITFPAQHSWWQVSNENGLLASLPVYFRVHDFSIPRDGFLLVTGDSVPDDGYQQTADSNSVLLGGIDPGTHFWKLELRSWNDSSITAAETTLHVEVVVDPSDDRSPWKYTLQDKERRPLVLVNPKFQKDQLNTRIAATECQSPRTSYRGELLQQLVVEKGLTFRSLQVFRNELSGDVMSSNGVIRALLASLYRRFPFARHNSRQISILNQAALRQLYPPYAARVWTYLVNALSFPCAEGLIIFSNSRSVSDELLVLAARFAGPKAIIMELANLHPTAVEVDILLAPSHFAKEHFSVARNVHARHQAVLSTGVSTRQFAPAPAPLSNEQGFVIGYVGRLASEKSLGILLAAMKIIQPICSQCRLKVVGDGPQKFQLRSLAFEWGLLGTSVEFVDGIYNDELALVKQFRQMHVFASPMFTETLGLAVLEAMSVGVPVVGFISGGTGEFLEDGVNCIAVTKATTVAFADALLSLVKDDTLRLYLGRQARHTVIDRFSTHKALEQYLKLYERAGWPLSNRAAREENNGQEEYTTCTEDVSELDA
ncbi:unnamed protein product [Phytophthora fragariaefolia]|uniref:Unnamed protein product n=1 Tax=Phytophthora fragariaefolia TaxID=1490495 RepID=A0A9W6XV42_9STRA|nr:unnamed protein product [Phytophthora fragariaefolia]